MPLLPSLFSPLDEALGLDGSGLSPAVVRRLVHLGADLPFARAAARLEELTGVVTSPATARRQTEAVGATAVALGSAASSAGSRSAAWSASSRQKVRNERSGAPTRG